jgi:hypothetical protein
MRQAAESQVDFEVGALTREEVQEIWRRRQERKGTL